MHVRVNWGNIELGDIVTIYHRKLFFKTESGMTKARKYAENIFFGFDLTNYFFSAKLSFSSRRSVMSEDIGASKSKSEPNVVPLCDILLVLLIIFMVITPVLQKGIDIKLPETSAEGTDSGPVNTGAIVLTMESDHTLKINQDPIELNLLETKLRDMYQVRQDKTIFIRADETLAYKDVLSIIDIATGAGIEVLGVIPERYTTNK
jgi:biopolymer transport protein ExbD